MLVTVEDHHYSCGNTHSTNCCVRVLQSLLRAPCITLHVRRVCIVMTMCVPPSSFSRVHSPPLRKTLQLKRTSYFRISQASEALKQIDIYEVVDADMGYATVDELESFFEIAFSCVKHKSKNRLEMQEAAARLRELQQVVIARMATSAP